MVLIKDFMTNGVSTPHASDMISGIVRHPGNLCALHVGSVSVLHIRVRVHGGQNWRKHDLLPMKWQ